MTEVERQNIKQQDEPQSFINTLSMPEALAHRALSSLRAEFERTGWAQPLAVAVVRVEHGLLMVYATADGASIWPSRVQLPEDMTPLADLVDVPPVLWGSTDPAVKLICLAHAGLRIEALLGNSEGTALVVQTAEQHAELQATGDVLPAVRSRSEGSDIEPSDVTRAERLVWDAPRVLDPEEAGKRLRALRWTDSQPAAYEAAHGDWVIAEIASSLANQNLASAIYLADQAFVQLHDNENPN
ncbi:hypothetical protein HMPREF9336_00405 [Segniliparus rugosus ATCC BAA-974]|uniref:Uncharacterized protein n=1 Tax=Segniliparus rugosus (strain ATCC BAA-974 / DSM 45345 / CCUG 50838 / CIP 108380 / JCM 13579 / CDC 945) TaxID=679197 RepID=E5XLN6_SEGRC|nr:hypothetical protein HMPREF9336_00405 [Segniliparus rugosus ATCC BAA-974]